MLSGSNRLVDEPTDFSTGDVQDTELNQTTTRDHERKVGVGALGRIR